MRQVGKFLVAVFVLTAVWGWTSVANAQNDFFKVKIDLVGQQGVNLLGFRLTHDVASPVFTFKRFKYTGPLQKEFLATALTGIAAAIPVFVFTDPADGLVPEILLMSLKNE